MGILNELMKNDQIKRSAVNEFGTGTMKKKEVKRWVKEKYPVEYHHIKKNIEFSNTIVFAPNGTETASMEEKIKAFQNREIDLKNTIMEMEDLIFQFMNNNDFHTIFLDFLKKEKDNKKSSYDELDMDVLMFRYIEVEEYRNLKRNRAIVKNV